MKLGMNLLLWTAAADERHLKLFEKIKSWGFDGVELPMFDAEGSPWNALARRLDDLGLGRTVVAVLPQGANLIGETTEERRAAVEFLNRCVQRCGELGAETLAGPIYSPVGRLVGRGPTEAERRGAIEGLRAVGEAAAGAGVTVAVEPLNRFETYFLNDQRTAGRLVDAVGSPAVGVLYDTFHANIEEKDPVGAIRELGPRIRHVHLSANDRATPGEDHIDWGGTFAALEAVGYDGWLTIESFGQWLPDLAAATCIWRAMAPSAEHVAREGAAFVRRRWGAARKAKEKRITPKARRHKGQA